MSFKTPQHAPRLSALRTLFAIGLLTLGSLLTPKPSLAEDHWEATVSTGDGMVDAFKHHHSWYAHENLYPYNRDLGPHGFAEPTRVRLPSGITSDDGNMPLYIGNYDSPIRSRIGAARGTIGSDPEHDDYYDGPIQVEAVFEWVNDSGGPATSTPTTLEVDIDALSW